MTLAAVVVTDLNNAIGKDNKLLCHLPADLKFFKAITMGAPIVMGRKTFESIGRVLPGRRNIVITRNTGFKHEGLDVYNSVEDCIKHISHEKAFVIGGAEIYRQTLPHISEVYRTLIRHRFEADTFFPELKEDEFKLVWEEAHQKDEKNPYDYTFQKFVRLYRVM
ncbi:MAG: dihydrofolate reductase [Bacteroidia bacterium]